MATSTAQEEMAECRLCGETTHISNIRKQLSSKIKGFVSFKELIEYFCRIELYDGDDLSLPEGVCSHCFKHLIDFCVFSVKVEKQQNLIINRANASRQTDLKERQEKINAKKIKATSPPIAAVAPFSPPTIKRPRAQSSSKNSSINSSASTNGDDAVGTESISPSRRTKRLRKAEVFEQAISELKTLECDANESSNSAESGGGGGGGGGPSSVRSENNIKKCFGEVHNLFKDKIAEREKSYEKITIKECLLQEGGEIPKTWLARYDSYVTWQDLAHECLHCNKNFKSFSALLLHFDELKIAVMKRSIKCPGCDAIFSSNAYIASYLNHVEKMHYNHLKFACVFCDKVFYNVMKMCAHAVQLHGHLRFKFYPCYDCGLVCSTLESLTRHKDCHEI